MGKKVCFFIYTISDPGGTERVTSEIANGLNEAGYDVTIVSLFKGYEPYFPLNPGIRLEQIFEQKQAFTRKYLKILWFLKNLMNTYRYDVLISVDTILSMYTIPASILAGNKTRQFAWEHFNYTVTFNLRIRKIARWLAARFASKVILLTKRDMELWTNGLGAVKNLISIPNPSVFGHGHKVEPYHSREKLVISVGRLTYQKGYDLLVKAWASIKNECPDWKLMIIGSGEDQEMLKKLAVTEKAGDSLTFVPAIKDVSPYYNRASLFCMSSRFEGLPMVLIEAQSFGLPIVSFDCDTGPSEVIEHHVSGILCEPMNIISLADGMKQCMQDEHARQRYNLAALDSALRFTKENIIRQWMKEIG